jgi:hypothetical protein
MGDSMRDYLSRMKWWHRVVAICALIGLPLMPLALPIGIEAGGQLIVPVSIVPSTNATLSLGSSTRPYDQFVGARINFVAGGQAIQSNGTNRITVTTLILYRSGVANVGTNAAHSFTSGNTLSGNTRIAEFHNDSAAATPEAFFLNEGSLITPSLRDSNLVQHVVLPASSATIVRGAAADGATADGVILDTSNNFTTAGANVVSITNQSVEKAFIDKDGQITQGAGTGAAVSVRVGGDLAADSTGVGNTGACGPDDLQSYTLPANTLVFANRGLKIRAYGTTANNANAKTVRLVFGGTTVLTKQLTASVAGTWEFEAVVLRTGASAQDIFSEAANFGGTTVSSTDGATVQNLGAFATATETETAAIVIKTQCTTATADSDIVSQGLVVEYL